MRSASARKSAVAQATADPAFVESVNAVNAVTADLGREALVQRICDDCQAMTELPPSAGITAS
jgi:hypothetical protein